MIELDDKLIKKFHQQKDGVYARDEEQRLLSCCTGIFYL